MVQKRKNYSKQFKIDAVKLITEQGYKVSEAAQNLGIHHSSIRRWKNQLEVDSNQAFPGKGHMRPGMFSGRSHNRVGRQVSCADFVLRTTSVR